MISSKQKQLIQAMTLAEKASLCLGSDAWHTQAIERLNIPALTLADGPNGLRHQLDETADFNLTASVSATCFPGASAQASSWDRSLIQEMATAIACEARAQHVHVVLGPGCNLKRSPLCGRNFEYFSEDPFLTAEMASAHIQGLQSQNIASSLKHFAANNQEFHRMTTDAKIDQRTLQEMYLFAFARAIEQAKPWTVMCAYNRLNGCYCSENSFLLTYLLRHKWQFDGLTISDWGAVNDRVAGLKAGLDLEMPGANQRDQLIIEALQQGDLDEKTVDQTIERLLLLIARTDKQTQASTFSFVKHHQLARRIAAESAVLLKNDGQLLPLAENCSIALIGEFAEKPRFQGGGSSHVNPTQIDALLNVLADNPQVQYAKGFRIDDEQSDELLIQQAQQLASKAEVAIVYLGLPDRYETEGRDRHHLELPNNQSVLLEAIIAVQSRIVVILANGAPVTMPWVNQVSSILYSHLAGQAVGSALADLLYGQQNPCGKLAETLPVCLEDTPAFDNFPSLQRPQYVDEVNYAERLWVGYRHYDAHQITPLFPFGHGLSYSEFTYRQLHVEQITTTATENDFQVTLEVENTGNRFGKEIVQLYLSDQTGEITVVPQQLKDFCKIALAPQQKQQVNFTLKRRDFAYFNTNDQAWRVPQGAFQIRVGASSRDIRLQCTIQVSGDRPLLVLNRNTRFKELLKHPSLFAQLRQQLAALSKKNSLIATLLAVDQPALTTQEILLRDCTLRALVSYSQGDFTEKDLDQLLQRLLNHGQ